MEIHPQVRYAKISDLTHIVEIYNQAIRSREATGDIDEFDVKDRIPGLNNSMMHIPYT